MATYNLTLNSLATTIRNPFHVALIRYRNQNAVGQWKQLGGFVRQRPERVERGQWGANIVLFRPASKIVNNDDADGEERNYLLMRTWTVFNADQVDGVAVQKYRSDAIGDDRRPKFDNAEELIAATQAELQFGGNQSYYACPVGDWPNHSGGDFVRLPHPSQFVSRAGYYETVLHELAHWSEVRLGWDRASNSYAMGELIAEIASCYLANEIEIPQGTDLANHASYLGSWLDSMKNDPAYIFKAATQASKVADFLMQFAPQCSPQFADR